MGKLFKFLKPYAAAVAAIICILVVQAYCDLSLPTYTSDIVNVGIQQGGIDEALPDTISKKDLNHLLLLVPSDRQKIVKNAYTESVEKYDYNGTVMELKASVEKHGLELSVIESVPVHEDIKLGLPTRDKYIANYCETIRNLSKAGIKTICYNFMPVFDWTRTQLDHELEDGSTSLVYYQEQVDKVIILSFSSTFISDLYIDLFFILSKNSLYSLLLSKLVFI